MRGHDHEEHHWLLDSHSRLQQQTNRHGDHRRPSFQLGITSHTLEGDTRLNLLTYA